MNQILLISTSTLAAQILNGFVLGAIFVLLSIGLSIIFGLMGVVNFAHGEFLLVGAYVGLSIMEYTGSFFVGLIVAITAVAAIGAFVERFLLRPIYHKDILLQVLVTFGLAVFIREGVQIIWGRFNQPFQPPIWADGLANLLLFEYPEFRLFVVTLSALIIASVFVFLRKTDVGLCIRAAFADREMVDILGIDVDRLYFYVFVLGSGLAGAAGMLIGPIRGAYPELGLDLILPAFVVVVIGGLGSLRGSIIAGLLVGELVVLTGVIYPPASEVVIYLFMAAILLARPRGLLGREVDLV